MQFLRPILFISALTSGLYARDVQLTGICPDLIWLRQHADAAFPGYEVQIAANRNFDRPEIQSRTPLNRFVAVGHCFEQGATYHWRVRSRLNPNAGWSEPQSFRVAMFDRNIITIDASYSIKDVRYAFDLARKTAPATVRLTEDVWWGCADIDIMKLYQTRDLMFDGDGHNIIVTNPANRLFHLDCCTNVVLRNFTVDYDPLPYVLCEVRSRDAGSNKMTLKSVCDAGGNGLELNDPRMLAADRTHMRQLDRSSPGAIKPRSETYIHDGKQSYLRSFVRNGELLHLIQLNPAWFKTSDFEVGDLMLRVARWDSRNILRAVKSVSLCISTVTAFASPSQFVSCIDGSALVVAHCAVLLKPGRYSSVTADCVYVRRNEIGPWVQSCEFVANGDDCMNFHSVGDPIATAVDDFSVKLKPYAVMRLDPGDQVALWTAIEGALPLRTKVVKRDVKSRVVSFADRIGIVVPDGDKKGGVTCVYNLTKNNRSFYVADNLIRNNSRFGVLLGSEFGVIENNTFERCASCALHIGVFPREGLHVADVMVRGNRISGCGYTKGYIENGAAAIQAGAYGEKRREISLDLHRNITVTNNFISGCGPHSVRLKGCLDSVVENNLQPL
jgi:hypothetical protein